MAVPVLARNWRPARVGDALNIRGVMSMYSQQWGKISLPFLPDLQGLSRERDQAAHAEGCATEHRRFWGQRPTSACPVFQYGAAPHTRRKFASAGVLLAFAYHRGVGT